MALRAGHVGVRAGQRKFRKGGVIESRRIPSARVVAGLAGRRKTRLCVRRIVRLIEVRHVAAHATCRRLCELAAGVAGIAIQSGVRTHQGEACELQVVELRAHPVVDGVTLFANRRHPQRDVIDSRGSGVNEVLLVARVAGGRKALELSYGRALVARVTTHGRVCARERKPVHVLVDLLDRNVPTFHRVALFTVRAHLRLVNVCMALAALCPDIREHRLGVALRARNPFVHSAQRIFCGVVIELRNGANRLPSAQRVTVLTRNAQASMGTARIRRRLRLRRRHAARQRRENDRQIKKECRTQGSPNSTRKDFDSRDGTSTSVSKVMRKNSNQTSSKLSHVRNVVEGYTSTWIIGLIS